MRIARSIALAAAFALTSLSALGSAHAECTVNQGKDAQGNATYAPICTNVTVETMYLHPSALYLKTSGTESVIHNNPNGCKLSENVFLKMSTTNPLLDNYLSMLMAAKLSGKTVNVRMTENKDGTCEIAYIILN